MNENNDPVSVSKGMKIVGWILTILPSLMLLVSSAFKFIQPAGPEFAEGLTHIGWTSEATFKLGFVEIACVLIYLFPRTAVLGAILLTAYMGGAIATHARVGDMFFTQILIGVFIWAGLYFRDPRVRRLLPIS